MEIEAYNGIPKKEIIAPRKTARGNIFTLKHPDELISPMRYKGVGTSGANSQGWERNSKVFFKEIAEKHPELFSAKNLARIQNGHAPYVNARFLKYFPQYKEFNGQRLIHHHIGRDGQAVALPSGIHMGSGDIHIVEDSLGISKNAEKFSQKCAQLNQREGIAEKNASELSEMIYRAGSRTDGANMRNAGSQQKNMGTETIRSNMKELSQERQRLGVASAVLQKTDGKETVTKTHDVQRDRIDPKKTEQRTGNCITSDVQRSETAATKYKTMRSANLNSAIIERSAANTIAKEKTVSSFSLSNKALKGKTVLPGMRKGSSELPTNAISKITRADSAAAKHGSSYSNNSIRAAVLIQKSHSTEKRVQASMGQTVQNTNSIKVASNSAPKTPPEQSPLAASQNRSNDRSKTQGR